MTRASHHRTEQIGLRLIHHIAPAVTQALASIQASRAIADGWPARGETAGGRGGGPTVRVDEDEYEGEGRIPVTGVEAAVMQAETSDRRREAILDTIESIEISVNHLARLVIGIDRTPAAGDEKRCADGQRSYGRVLTWSSNDACPELPVKMGMCEAHYRAYLRFRQANHLPVAQYFEAATNANWGGGV